MKKLLIFAFMLLSGTIFLGNIPKQDLTNIAGKQMAATTNDAFLKTLKFTPNTVANNQPSGALVDSQGNDVTQLIPTYQRYSGSSGGSVAPAIDQSLVNQYDQSIGNTQAAINRLGDQFNSGASQIDSSYTNALNQLLGSKNQANKAYDQNVLQGKQDYVGGKNTVRANAGSSLNSLLRLLGSRGAGGSSAATITAPGAVARNATLQQTDLGNTFGKNQQALDTGWNTYLTDYNNQVSSAGSQRDQSKSELQRQIDTNRASLLQTLASLSGQRAQAAGGSATGAAQPYLDQANAVLDQTSRYNIAPINYQTQAYTPPSLDKYTVNPNAAPTYQGQQASNDYYSPYLSALLGKKQLQGA